MKVRIYINATRKEWLHAPTVNLTMPFRGEGGTQMLATIQAVQVAQALGWTQIEVRSVHVCQGSEVGQQAVAGLDRTQVAETPNV